MAEGHNLTKRCRLFGLTKSPFVYQYMSDRLDRKRQNAVLQAIIEAVYYTDVLLEPNKTLMI
jgi:hypothetical protein